MAGRPVRELNSNARSASRSSTIFLHRPAGLPENVWPFQTLALETGDGRIAFTDVGQGPVLLFVHTGFWSFLWRDVLLRLAPDYRCICFDAPGTGQSDRLPVDRINLERAPRALPNIIRTLNLTDITLVVHDLGGPSGIAGAARVADRIRGLCAVNTFAWKPSGAAFGGMLRLIGSAAIREINAFTGILPRITSRAFGVGRRKDESSRKAFLAGIGRQGIRSFHAYVHDALRCEALYDQLDEAFSGPFRRLPVLTIFGERNDPFGFQPRWKQLFSDARQVVVPGGNHFPMCDDPDLVAGSIRGLYHGRIAPALAINLRKE